MTLPEAENVAVPSFVAASKRTCVRSPVASFIWLATVRFQMSS
jgi:hypothetical protein